MLSTNDSRITRNGKAIILAHDHGLEHGPTKFEGVRERLDPETVFEMATHDAVTGFAVGKGLAETYYPSYEDDVSLLAKLNGGSSLWMGEPDTAVNWSVDYAAELGADAVGFTIYPGSNHELEMAEEFSDVQETAREFDLPVAMWSYPRGQGIKDHRKPEVIAYATRIALELGADIAKVKYPRSPEAMQWAVEAAGDCKVVLSGGAKTGDHDFLSTVEAAMDAGAAGLAVGRNVWQHEDPTYILDALEEVVFEGATAEEALDS
ncbi:fructose-bisphosphate aldolase, class I [Halogranum amylolyticum]|uniref:fructose-bisphosphate aldolase n=1 Tax=Halogranum amylolyticum TaxID=660520 RepID=A0A1H8TLB8_9EURY|nr:class I fructose-bisphosphate aldolase [Halogranum amylolyticum]SEO91374.1 fructose-bisphosphate aldolase, class I [Halogranum amylolyticum]